MKIIQPSHAALPQDPVVSYIESKTATVYSQIVRGRDASGPLKGFEVATLTTALLAAQTEATRRREAELEKLRS
jgi:hypothetical protein